MSKHFKNVISYENLKEQFKILLKANHPDNGGNEDTMKEINCEYDALFPIWKDRKEVETGDTVQETASSTRSKFYTECGWEGKNHNSNYDLKEIAQIVRAYVKEKYPTYKFSVRTSYGSMSQELRVDLKESPIEIYKTGEELNENDKAEFRKKAEFYGYFTLNSWNDAEFTAEYKRVTSEHGNYFKVVNEATKAVIGDVNTFVDSYNCKDCDSRIDYHYVDFYYFGCADNNGTDIKVVPKTARIKNKAAKPAKASNPAPEAEKPSIEHKNDYTYKISKGEDTRDGSELWVVRIVENLGREEYLEMNKKMQDLGGYYSKFKHGFIFRFDPTETLNCKNAA